MEYIKTCEQWLCNEAEFISEKEYENPFEQTLDLILICGETKLTVPGFFDGGKSWKVRFALTKIGIWQYFVKFSDSENSGFKDLSGEIECVAYSGDLDIYKHGFVQAQKDKKYFVYADGTPFLYIGDTHWNFLAEEFDEPGDHAGNISEPHFKYIIKKRVQQGFTVYQTEPNHLKFGIEECKINIDAFKYADKYFEFIAKSGLVHANAQFFFTSSMSIMTQHAGFEEFIKIASRYWVARYGAYPVMWTIAQEVDKEDYYVNIFSKGMGKNYREYPFLLIARAIGEADTYKHPLSAHQGSPLAQGGAAASNSTFKDEECHTWWASQWKPKLNEPLDFQYASDYWYNGKNKPAIVYEGRYDHLWTNEYGARVQGWLAFLNGMYGHGYGCVDMWLYKSTYDIEHDTLRDGILTTVQDKAMFWSDSIELPSGYQMKVLKEFFEKFDWWKMVPCFDENKYFTIENKENNFGCCSTVGGNEIYIAYFYGESNGSGKLLNMDELSEYTYQWFDPRTGAICEPKKIKKGTEFNIGERPSAEDWVLVVKK